MSEPRSAARRTLAQSAFSGASGGSTRTMTPQPTTLRTPMTVKAVRHPAASPRKVPSGTPSTDPRGTAEKITAVALPTDSGGTSRPASPAPIDQNPPMVTPTRTRETRTSQYAGATATTKFASASSAMKAHSMTRRSTRAVAVVTSGADSAARKPGIVIVSPAVPSVTSKLRPISGSRPIGRISTVTMAKSPAVTEQTASQLISGERGSAPERSAVVVRVCGMGESVLAGSSCGIPAEKTHRCIDTSMGAR
ncbi:hypothetical protein SMD44_00599 [Streptomyces alboflavus]|uniref:Uncharacterized protein n=1 Tax=Streptomyces alboflavus TaxID=67267 RepID=A0A1Z1W454_9ACTN|nr:hypothetical protein SMD44_00599 [Streptomyces alboflavus]